MIGIRKKIQDSRFRTQDKKGFTLLELVVVVALFMLLIDVTVTVFVSVIKYQRKILGEQELLNQVGYGIEYVSRAMRTAVKDETASCLFEGQTQFPNYMYLLTRYDAASGFYKGVKFIDYNNVCREFFQDTDGIFKEVKNTGLSSNVLSNNLVVNYFRPIINGDKTVRGASQGDTSQARLSFGLKVRLQSAAAGEEKLFQTTISHRNLNVSD